MRDPIVTEELELLDRVNTTLARGPAAEPPDETAIVEELEKVREQLLRGQLDDFERSALETRWTIQSAVLRQIRSSREAPQIDPESPYFAHLRLRENGRVRDLCLGKATFLDHGLRIVDWRHAPVAQLYYRYRQEEEYEEDLNGRTVTGSVEVRRAVAIRDAALQRVEAPEGVWITDSEAPDGWRRADQSVPRLAGGEGSAIRMHRDEEALERRLGTDPSGTAHRVDKRLPDIAGLIDPEQFALIARPAAGYAAIRGAAGSGKTTVALHRIAYLAYQDPSVDSGRTLVLAFSPGLRNYVSHVLPALGVHSAQVRTWTEWASEQRRRLFPRLPTRIRDDAPTEVQRVKLHPALLGALPRHIEANPGKATPEQVLDDWMSVMVNRDLLEAVFAEHSPGSLRPRELDRVVDWCRERNRELRNFIDGDRESQAALDPEDDALLLRAWQLRIGPLPEAGNQTLRYRHIAIDEVQDFAHMEVRVLLDCLDEHRSLTLAGDTQQHVVADAGFTSWTDFFRDLGLAGTEVSTLQTSYRSSREITEFAIAVLGDLRDRENPVVTTRSGPPVELFTLTDPGACVAFLAEALNRLAADEPLASVAVLTPSPEASDLYHEGLVASDVARVHRVRNQDFRFAPGIEITEIEQVKGLEFDYVVMVDVDADAFPDNPAARRRLHVGATRAIHQLWITCIESPSPLVRELGEASPTGS